MSAAATCGGAHPSVAAVVDVAALQRAVVWVQGQAADGQARFSVGQEVELGRNSVRRRVLGAHSCGRSAGGLGDLAPHPSDEGVRAPDEFA